MRTHLLAAVAALCVSAGTLAAQGPPRLGGQLSFAQDVNAGVGLRLEQGLMPPRAQDLRLMAAFDYYFPNSPLSYWELNGDLAWGFRFAGSRAGMYLGGGINVARSGIRGVPNTSETNIGANLLAGLRFPTGGRATPYVELRPELGGGNRLVLSTGVMF